MNARRIFCHLLLIQCSLASSNVSQIHYNVISAMAASREMHVRTVLMLSQSDTERIYSRVNEFPIALKFLVLTKRAIRCEFYPYHGRENCGVSSEQREYFITVRRLLYLPFLSSVQGVHRPWLLMMSRRTKHQLIVSSEKRNETLRYFLEGICNVVIVNSRGINAPQDRYRRCEQRKDFTAARFVDPEVASPQKFPKHKKYIAGHLRRGSGKYLRKPDILALLDVYRSLNNTVHVTAVKDHGAIVKKSVDLLLFPLNAAFTYFLDLVHFFVYANYSPLRLCFFTKIRNESRMSFIDSWDSLLQFLFVLVLAAIIVILCALVRRRVLFREPAFIVLANISLFMLSTFVGRSFTMPSSQAAVYRSLAVASWSLGMLFLGNYAQTSITAIRIVPSASPPIRTLEELNPYASECVLTACGSMIWEPIITDLFMPNSALAFAVLKKIIYCRGFDSSAEDISRCYQKVQAGTHLAFSTCSDEDISVASKWGLVPSNELCTLPQVAGIHLLNPARYQHRRVLLAIAEHGLAVPHRIRVAQRMIVDYPGKEPFMLYCAIFLVGCAVSWAALAAELLCGLRHRPRGGRILQ